MSAPPLPQSSRRDVLKAAAVTGAAAALAAGCEDITSAVAQKLGQSVPATVALPEGPAVDDAFHLLSRAGYGPWPGDLEAVKSIGPDAWVEQQLDPDAINDSACDLRVRRYGSPYFSIAACYEYKKDVLRDEMSRYSLLKAVYSKRQLFEVMVSFWTDHLNINIEKGDCIYLKPWDDREVIRKHALGKFRDLVGASAVSPAMLIYLDGNQNARAKPEDVPNENYARELMELHTMGVDGGYTQADVYEVARCLTGWRVRSGFRKGSVYFDLSLHDNGEKRVLGHTIAPGGGEQGLQQVVDIVCRHPSTARYVSKKLVQRFVSEDPPAALVDRVAAKFTETDGDVKSLVRTVLSSEEFKQSKGKKFKTPFRFVASALRAVGADTHAHSPLIEYLTRMGQGVFQYPTPDGYPDEAAPWLGTLLWRWNLGFALAANQVPSVKVPLAELVKAVGAEGDGAGSKLFRYFCGADPGEAQRAALAEAGKALAADGGPPVGLAGLILASPGFQRC